MVRCGPSNFFLKSSSHKSWNSIYEFTVKDINGVDVSLEKYRGHVCLIVNVACNYRSDADDLYKFLKSRLHGTLTNDIKWNFSKFLVDRQGQPVKRYSPTTAPYDIEGDIMELLEKK
ncbi:unnamed protein product [Schistosoma rodhaini]|nr:unnamed protein product [Schistosoma rodhaini]